MNPKSVVTALTNSTDARPQLKCDECGEWLTMGRISVARFVRLALFWAKLHLHRKHR